LSSKAGDDSVKRCDSASAVWTAVGARVTATTNAATIRNIIVVLLQLADEVIE
jgi:hypothetical protein